MVIHAKEHYRDILLDLGISGPMSAEKYSEFVTILVDQVKKLTDVAPAVIFSETIKYNNSRTQKNAGTDCVLNFQKNEDPKQVTQSSFKQGKGNTNIITYKTQ